MHGVGLADVGDARFRQSKEPDLAHLDEFLHRADGLLDRHIRVDPVLVIQVDVVDAEATQGVIASPVNILGSAADAHPGAVRVPYVAELGRQLHVNAAT